jgi:hypothetical protein
MKSIELLIENEKSVSRLYALFAERFSEEKKFWLKKSAEEDTHAELLEGIDRIVRETPALFAEGRFNAEVIESTTELVKDALQKSKSCSLPEALTIAREIENSLIERNFFKVISSDSALVRDAFNQIEQDTKIHREEIQELWLKYAL